jgi:hypothetical protein
VLEKCGHSKADRRPPKGIPLEFADIKDFADRLYPLEAKHRWMLADIAKAAFESGVGLDKSERQEE